MNVLNTVVTITTIALTKSDQALSFIRHSPNPMTRSVNYPVAQRGLIPLIVSLIRRGNLPKPH